MQRKPPAAIPKQSANFLFHLLILELDAFCVSQHHEILKSWKYIEAQKQSPYYETCGHVVGHEENCSAS